MKELPPSSQTGAPIRVGYIVSQYPATNHTYILREIRGLRSLGVDVCVVSIRKPDRGVSGLSAEEAEEYALTFSVLGAGVWNALWVHLRTLAARPVAYSRALRYALRLAGPNLRRAAQYTLYFGEAVVAGDFLMRQGIRHAHTHFSSTVTLMMSKLFPISFSATIHGPAEFREPHFHMPEKLAEALFVRTISEFGRGEVLRLAGRTGDRASEDRVEVNRLGVDPAEFTPSHGPAGGRFEMLMVGQLAPAKNPLLLMAAIGQLVSAGRTNLRLRWAGDGPLRTEVETYVAAHDLQKYVDLLGNCLQGRVRELYRETDLFVLASLAEGIPVVLMEAMAMEVACLATRITGIPELICHEEDGWLIPSGDEAELIRGIANLMDHPELRERLGRAGRARVLRDYDLATNVERLDAMFRRRLAKT